MVSGWVVGVDRISPSEIMGREVLPAAVDPHAVEPSFVPL
jgi:hypothetical protein